MMHWNHSRRVGLLPTLPDALLCFDLNSMMWVLLGALGKHLTVEFALHAARKGLRITIALLTGLAAGQPAAAAGLQKADLKCGLIKLTDCAPIIIAKELDFFEDEDLYVAIEAQSNWKILLDRVISGELDGAHMLAGQPLAATIGFGTKAHITTVFTMDLNGNGITLANSIWEQMKEMNPSLRKRPVERPLKADLLKPVVQELIAGGAPMRMGMVLPAGGHQRHRRLGHHRLRNLEAQPGESHSA